MIKIQIPSLKRDVLVTRKGLYVSQAKLNLLINLSIAGMFFDCATGDVCFSITVTYIIIMLCNIKYHIIILYFKRQIIKQKRLVGNVVESSNGIFSYYYFYIFMGLSTRTRNITNNICIYFFYNILVCEHMRTGSRGC